MYQSSAIFAANCTLSLNPGTGENAPGIGLYRSSKADSIPELRLSFSEQMPKTGKLEILVDGKPELDTNIAALKVRNNETRLCRQKLASPS